MEAQPASNISEDEIVARAIFLEDGWVKTTWETVGSICKDKYLKLAGAAIKAVRTIEQRKC